MNGHLSANGTLEQLFFCVPYYALFCGLYFGRVTNYRTLVPAFTRKSFLLNSSPLSLGQMAGFYPHSKEPNQNHLHLHGHMGRCSGRRPTYGRPDRRKELQSLSLSLSLAFSYMSPTYDHFQC